MGAGEVLVFPEVDDLAEAAADRFAALASAAVAERGRFSVALAGGSTPEPVYARLAEEPLDQEIDWTRVEVFWGDERCVPPDHPDSNYRMARQVLLRHVSVPDENVHRIKGELAPEEAAVAYRLELQKTLSGDGRFDLILLGMGADGHTASLFPGTEAVNDRERSVVPVYVAKADSWRVTLTLPVINAAREVMFLVVGERKASALAMVRAGQPLPAAMVRPVHGRLTWLIDRDAAAWLDLK